MSDEKTEPAHEPNEEGFGGDPSTPEPTGSTDDDVTEGERVAVPDTDLIRPVGEALQPGVTDEDRG